MNKYYTTSDMIEDVMNARLQGNDAYITRHGSPRMGPVLEVKHLGFGTTHAMILLRGPSWVTVDPMMCKFTSEPR